MSEHIIDEILRREGSTFTDHPADRGGPTRYGITQRTWDDYRRRCQIDAPGHVRDLSESDARVFYYRDYIEPWSWIQRTSLRELVIDSCVQHGSLFDPNPKVAKRIPRWLQEASGVEADGIVGPKTRTAVNRTALGVIEKRFFKRRAMFYIEIVLNDNSQLIFLRGWFNRLLEFA